MPNDEMALEALRDHPMTVDDIQRLMRAGEYLAAYDGVQTLLEATPDDAGLKYLAVLALARSGAAEQALEHYGAYGLGAVRSEDAAALLGRIKKDLALRVRRRARPTAFLDASRAYADAFQIRRGYFPAINVATLAALAGEKTSAAEWAERALAIAEPLGEAEGYFAHATCAEAHLLLGNMERVQASLEAALAADGADDGSRASTLRQLRLITSELGLDEGPLALLRPPPILHYFGHIVAAPGAPGRFPADQADDVRSRVEDALDRTPVGAAFGSIAAGADILVAEALLDRNVDIEIVLPFDLEPFVAASVAPSGADWVERMERCLDRAARRHVVASGGHLGDDALFGYASEYALGLAALKADRLQTEVRQLAVWDREDAGPSAVAGTAHDLALGRDLGVAQKIIEVRSTASAGAAGRTPTAPLGRQSKAIMFSDLKGFSRLTDAQMPAYVAHVLGAIADVMDDFEANVRFCNTWGDGLFVILDDLERACDCAFALHAALERLDWRVLGLPDTLKLRLGLHYGPVFEARDPVLDGRSNFFGSHVSRAARIEPRTPEGRVYVTEHTAAALAVRCAGCYRTEYVGRIALPKGYGTFPMYDLRPAG